MGAGTSGKPTRITIENEIAAFINGLPMAELLNGGIIRLSGASGYFNPNSLLEASWLQGKMTVDEYKSAINSINNCAMRTQLEMGTRLWTKETYAREKEKAEAGQAAVEQLNKKYKSIRFTYHQSIEKMEYIPVYNSELISLISVLSERGRYLTVRSYIYINVN